MTVAVLLRPAAPEMPAGTPSILPRQLVDPAFEQRWTAWRARGDRQEAQFRRTVRIVAIALLAIVALVVLGIRLLGGAL
jgi:hypothetical protein